MRSAAYHTFDTPGCSMIGLVFATTNEATTFLEQHAEGRFDGIEDGQHVQVGNLLVTVTGPGKIKATLGTEQFLQRHDPDLLLHAGGAAALTDELEVGTLVGVTFVLEGDRVDLDTPTYPRMPLEMPFDLSAEGTLVTQDHTTEDPEELSYWERIADLRDSTGYAVAYVAAQHGTPCHIVKGVTAPPNTDPDPDDQQTAHETIVTFLDSHLDAIATESSTS